MHVYICRSQHTYVDFVEALEKRAEQAGARVFVHLLPDALFENEMLRATERKGWSLQLVPGDMWGNTPYYECLRFMV